MKSGTKWWKPLNAVRNLPKLKNSVAMTKQRITPVTVETLGIQNIPPELAIPVPNSMFRSGRVVTFSEFDENVQQFCRIKQVHEVDPSKLGAFVKCSCDLDLIDTGIQQKAKVVSSTSSTTNFLCQLYYLTSGFADINMDLFPSMKRQPSYFTRLSVAPSMSMLVKREGTVPKQSIWVLETFPKNDSNASNRVLMDLGHVIEGQLTMNPLEFRARFLKEKDKLPSDVYTTKTEGESYKMSRFGGFLVRSQLDCRHASLPPDNNVFDLKTRAIRSMRWDMENYTNYLDVELSSLTGQENSYEAEVYDMARAAMIKYYFQVRLGQMHGIMVAYHNTRKLFGMQYFSQEMLENHLSNVPNKCRQSADSSLVLSDLILRKIVQEFDAKSSRVIITSHANQELDCVTMFLEAVDKRPQFKAPTLQELRKQAADEGVPEHEIGPLITSRDSNLIAGQVTNWSRQQLIESADAGFIVKYVVKARIGAAAEKDQSPLLEYEISKDTQIDSQSLVHEYVRMMEISREYPSRERL